MFAKFHAAAKTGCGCSKARREAPDRCCLHAAAAPAGWAERFVRLLLRVALMKLHDHVEPAAAEAIEEPGLAVSCPGGCSAAFAVERVFAL